MFAGNVKHCTCLSHRVALVGWLVCLYVGWLVIICLGDLSAIISWDISLPLVGFGLGKTPV